MAPAAHAGAGAGGAPGQMTGGGGMFGGTGRLIPPQDAAQVSANWPAGNIDIRMSNYMCQAQQKWTVTPVASAGGYPGSPYFKITIAGTNRTLAVGEDGELVALPAFTGGTNSSGVSTSSPTAPGGSCPSSPRPPRNRWPFRPSAAVSRRSRSLIPTATNNAGSSRRPDNKSKIGN